MSTDQAITAATVATVWTDPSSPRAGLDDAALDPQADPGAWPAALDAEARRGLLQRAETQLLRGEPVLVDEERDGWTRIVAPWQPSSKDDRGYPGWVPSSMLAEPRPRTEAEQVVCHVSATPVNAEPAAEAEVLAPLSYATVASVIDHSDDGAWLRLDLPGAVGWVDAAAFRPFGVPGRVTADGDGEPEQLTLARQFVGLQYLWGGVSGWGLDCSGLVHATFRVLGRTVQRDAHDQQRTVAAVDLDAVRPGDLYFFARDGKPPHHVGFVSQQGMLHAPMSGRGIEDSAMDGDRRATLAAAGRVV